MIRKIIQIDEAKCNGCSACANACHEGAIGMVNGKARLLRDDYCDGLGDCLPSCPTGAISFTEREAAPYDEAAVKAAQRQKKSCLSQWPVQLRLVPANAPYFDGTELLIAADCTAFARRDFHDKFIRDRIALVGCPKLDPVDYTEKLTEIIRGNEIRGITVARMEVPCCGGLERAVRAALQASGKDLVCRVAVISTDGRILNADK